MIESFVEWVLSYLFYCAVIALGVFTWAWLFGPTPPAHLVIISHGITWAIPMEQP